MSQLSLIIKNEYLTDIKQKSFWISTFALPLIGIVFGIFIGFMADDSDVLKSVTESTSGNADDLSGQQIFGMLIGCFLTLFLMIYGAQIFNKVKIEKNNRIAEVLSSCIDGRTMMLGKIISVGLTGLTQIFLWAAMVGIIGFGVFVVSAFQIPWSEINFAWLLQSFFWIVAFFISGYVFYASMFAVIGAMTDKNNENQEYLTLLTFILLGSFYLGMFAVDNSGSMLTMWCTFIPFTSPTVATVNAVSGEAPVWISALALIILSGFAGLVLSLSGKVYTSSLLLRGKRLSPKDLITFLKSK